MGCDLQRNLGLLPSEHEGIAQPSCNNLLNTKSQSEHQDHEEKNNDYFNLSLCLFLFLGVFVFEDFLAKKKI